MSDEVQVIFYPALFIALPLIITQLVSLYISWQNGKKAIVEREETKAQLAKTNEEIKITKERVEVGNDAIRQLEVHVDGRLTKLLEQTEIASHLLGKEEGKRQEIEDVATRAADLLPITNVDDVKSLTSTQRIRAITKAEADLSAALKRIKEIKAIEEETMTRNVDIALKNDTN